MPSSYSSSRTYYRPPPPEHAYTSYYDPSNNNLSLTTVATCVVAGLFLIYQLLADVVALPSPLAMVGLLFGPAAREYLQNAFATSPRQVVSQVRDRAASMVGRPLRAVDGGIVGGLWNVGNTCYQNSVLQALASLESLHSWLEEIPHGSAAEALGDLVHDLNTVSDRPRVETASTLITQASSGTRGWMFNEQQDAQEFLQGLMGVLEKEVAEADARRKGDRVVGLEGLLESKLEAPAVVGMADVKLRSPFEGLLAQRVGCLRCGYVDSISLQPFTTLSLPIPSTWATTLEDCLRAFTTIEQIPQVDCDKCTLLSIRNKLQQLLALPAPEGAEYPEYRTIADARLLAVTAALKEDNFAPQIPGVKLDGAMKVSSTKTKQVMVARAPQVLVLHTNRSQFDILTGMVGKNYAAVRFPAVLDLTALGVVTRHDNLSTSPGEPISSSLPGEEMARDTQLEAVYELKAVVAHYGGHHNGHYVAYRCWAERWWRISDHEVVACAEEDALAASNAFMLFYERTSEEALAVRREEEAARPPIEALITSLPPSDDEAEEEEEKEAVEEEPAPSSRLPIPPHPQLLPTPPESGSEDEEEGKVVVGKEEKFILQDTPPMEAEEDIDDVPELDRDVSSRDSSPTTPPASALSSGGGGGKRRRGRVGRRKNGRGREEVAAVGVV